MTSEALFRRALSAIALIGFGALAGIVVLAVVENPVPDVLQNLAVGSLTALAGMLSRPPSTENPMPVEVVDAAPTRARRARKDAGHGDVWSVLAVTLLAALVCVVILVLWGDDLITGR